MLVCDASTTSIDDFKAQANPPMPTNAAEVTTIERPRPLIELPIPRNAPELASALSTVVTASFFCASAASWAAAT